jgi:hypothetical protein
MSDGSSASEIRTMKCKKVVLGRSEFAFTYYYIYWFIISITFLFFYLESGILLFSTRVDHLVLFASIDRIRYNFYRV